MEKQTEIPWDNTVIADINCVGKWLACDETLPANTDASAIVLAGNAVIPTIDAACRLAAKREVPLLISGGLHYGQPPSEAAMMADVLQRDFGVATRWREERSRTTWENALFTAELLKAQGVNRVVLVTQAAHMPRARWCFERAGLEVVAAPLGFLGVPNERPLGGWLPEGKALWQSTRLLNEAIGLAVYPLLYR